MAIVQSLKYMEKIQTKKIPGDLPPELLAFGRLSLESFLGTQTHE